MLRRNLAAFFTFKEVELFTKEDTGGEELQDIQSFLYLRRRDGRRQRLHRSWRDVH